jgi:putative transposase
VGAASVDSSVGSVGDAYDNALAESQSGLSKAEVIRPEAPWRGVEHVDLETLTWGDFFNKERLHEALADLTPIAAAEPHQAAKNELMPIGRAHDISLRKLRLRPGLRDGTDPK